MLRICIIDDHRLVRDALALSFEAFGLHVCSAEDLATALSCIETAAPHVALADVQQPGVEDASLVVGLLSAFPALPVVAMSGNPHLESKARAAGAVGFVAKPFRVEALLPTLRALTQKPVTDAG